MNKEKIAELKAIAEDMLKYSKPTVVDISMALTLIAEILEEEDE